MATPKIRGGSSGPAIQPLPGKGNPSLALLATPVTCVILPAGHAPGLYNVHAQVFNRVLAGAGNYTSNFSWDQQFFGPMTLPFGAVSLTSSTAFATISRALYSSGAGAISYTITPAGVTGAPTVNLICTSELIALPVAVSNVF